MNIELVKSEDLARLDERIASLEQKIDALREKTTHKELYTVGEVCQLLKVSKRTLQNYRDHGVIQFTQLGKKILFTKADIEDLVERYRVNLLKRRGGRA